MAYILKDKLWYTKDKTAVVKDGDPKAAFLLGIAGRVISDDEAKRLGLVAEPKAKKSTPNKRRSPAKNKGK